MLLKAYEAPELSKEERAQTVGKENTEGFSNMLENIKTRETNEENIKTERKESRNLFCLEPKKRLSMLNTSAEDRFSHLSRIRHTIFQQDARASMARHTKRKRNNSLNKRSSTIYRRVAELRVNREVENLIQEESDGSFTTCYDGGFFTPKAELSSSEHEEHSDIWTPVSAKEGHASNIGTPEDRKSIFELAGYGEETPIKGNKTSSNKLSADFKDVPESLRNTMTFISNTSDAEPSPKTSIFCVADKKLEETLTASTVNEKQVQVIEVADKEQVLKDITRSMNNIDYFNSLNEEVALDYKEQLKEMLFALLGSNKFHYYQGYNELCSIFLLILGKKKALKAAELVSKNLIHDFLLDSFEKGVRPMLFTFNNLLESADKEVYQSFAQLGVLLLRQE